MPLFKAQDSAAAAPKYLGVVAENTEYAKQANVTHATTGVATFTNGSNVITLATTSSGVVVNQLVTSNTANVNATLSPSARVSSIINATAVQMSQTFTGNTNSSANIAFVYEARSSNNLYQNPQNSIGEPVSVWNLTNKVNYVTFTANTIAGNNVLTNPSAVCSNVQTGVALNQGNAIVVVSSTANLSVGEAIYSAAANTTGGAPFVNGVSVASIINSTAFYMSAVSPITNASTTLVFSNIQPGMVVSGPGIPAIASNTGTLTTLTANITGTISNGTIGQTGNVLNVTAIAGPYLALNQELLANATSGVSNGVYITSFITGTGGVGTYGVSANLAANGASGVAATFKTVIPSVVYVNSTAIQLSANAYAIGSYTGNTYSVSSYEKTVYGKGLSAGWIKQRFGVGPVTAFTVNSTSTSGYANGETIVVSNGSVNAIGIITTNTNTAAAGANIASVSVAYPGAGFTNASILAYTYQHQQHLSNVNISGTTTGMAVGDTFNVTCSFALASFTGVIADNVLTASAVTGTITIGNAITGTGVAAGTRILAQLTGTAGGAGTYAVSGLNHSVPSTAMTMTGQILAATANIASAATNSGITVTNGGLFMSGLTAANLVVTYANTGGGTYSSGATLTGTFAAASSGASVNATLGGRSGRVYNEVLATLTSTSPYTNQNAADNGQFPDS